MLCFQAIFKVFGRTIYDFFEVKGCSILRFLNSKTALPNIFKITSNPHNSHYNYMRYKYLSTLIMILLLLVVKLTLSFRFDWKLIHFIDHENANLPGIIQDSHSFTMIEPAVNHQMDGYSTSIFSIKYSLSSYFTYWSYKCYLPHFPS